MLRNHNNNENEDDDDDNDDVDDNENEEDDDDNDDVDDNENEDDDDDNDDVDENEDEDDDDPSGAGGVQQVELVHRRPAAIGRNQDRTSIRVCDFSNFEEQAVLLIKHTLKWASGGGLSLLV